MDVFFPKVRRYGGSVKFEGWKNHGRTRVIDQPRRSRVDMTQTLLIGVCETNGIVRICEVIFDPRISQKSWVDLAVWKGER